MSTAPYKPLDARFTALSAEAAFHTCLCAEFVYYRSAESWPDRLRILRDLQTIDERYTDVRGEKIDNSEAIIAVHDDYVVIAFAGTNEGADWASNFDWFPAEKNGGKFHRGFYECFEELWPWIEATLAELNAERVRPIYIAGHSLGGAIATCCAAYFNYLDRPFMSLYTFGSPRAAERDTAVKYDVLARSRTFRFQLSADVVTRLPARIAGYSHTGTTLFVDDEGVIHTDPGWWLRFLDFVRVVTEDIMTLDLSTIVDHDIRGYRRAIDAWRVTQ